MVPPPYALVTAAKDEADLIERTLDSIVRQTILPVRWVIVSDGSTDATDEIVHHYASRYAFIELQRLEGTSGRSFRSKAVAVQHGYEAIKHLDFSYIGNLDADVCLDPTYYEQILGRFEADSRLGIAGGTGYDFEEGQFRRLLSARNSVAGPFQMFRRQCWMDIGGYQPLAHGGIDAVAEITARMKGWRVELFRDIEVRHYRETGTATRNRYAARFQDGLKFYALGYHPLFFVARTVYRVCQPPRLLGALLAMLGYAYAVATRQERQVSRALVAYLHDEQLRRLRLRRTRSATTVGMPNGWR